MMDGTPTTNGDSSDRESFPNFGGTDVPRKALFDHLAEGGTLDTFVAKYPAVTYDRAQAILLLAEIKQDELTKAGSPPETLHAAYLQAVTPLLNHDGLHDLQELVDALDDPDAFERLHAAGKWRTFEEMMAEIENDLADRCVPGTQQ